MRLDPAPAGIGHGGPLAPVCDQRRDRLPEPPAIAGGNDDARLGRHHLSDRAYCCGYDRRAARHRLQDDPRDSVSQAGEHEHIGLLIGTARRRIKQALGSRVRHYGLTPRQFWILVALYEHPGLSLRELAASCDARRG